MRIDPWTLALQTVNVLVLVWLLAHFLFRPVAAVIAARRAAADKLLADAEAQRQHAADAVASVAREREGLGAEGQRILADARAAAEREHATLLQQATDAAARLGSEAEQAMARERQAMREALEREATDLALAIATRLLQRVPPRDLNRAFVETLAKALATHPARALLAQAELELRCAVPLDGASQADTSAILARALGAPPHVTFRTDPTLLSGVELAGPSLLIRNSWRADLEQISHALQETGENVLFQPMA